MPTCVFRPDAESVLEADDGAVVQAEQISQQVPEVAFAKRAAEAMCHAKRALHRRHAKGRRQAHEREVRLREVEHGRVVVVLGERGRCGHQREGEDQCESNR